ncbi:MAG: hypothetical protein ACXAC7_16280 [Candidatus Hodarchaeales archaeon]|jgi:hypothetical protein
MQESETPEAKRQKVYRRRCSASKSLVVKYSAFFLKNYEKFDPRERDAFTKGITEEEEELLDFLESQIRELEQKMIF